MPSLDVDQKSTCTAPGGGGVKETKQYFEEEGDQIYLGGLGPLFNNGTGDTEDREDDRPSSDSFSSNVSSNSESTLQSDESSGKEAYHQILYIRILLYPLR